MEGDGVYDGDADNVKLTGGATGQSVRSERLPDGMTCVTASASATATCLNKKMLSPKPKVCTFTSIPTHKLLPQFHTHTP